VLAEPQGFRWNSLLKFVGVFLKKKDRKRSMQRKKRINLRSGNRQDGRRDDDDKRGKDGIGKDQKEKQKEK